MVNEAAELRQTPLHQIHLDANADMKPFGGWSMPMTYPTGGLAEHHAVRGRGDRQVGIFDVSHMGRIHLRGRDALPFIDSLVVSDINKVNPSQAKYTLMLNSYGGIIDDLLVYRTNDPEHIALVVNAGNRETDLEWLEQQKVGLCVEIEDETTRTALIAVQGPASIELVRRLSQSLDVPEYYYFTEGAKVGGIDMLVSRTGYTGEDGVEIWFDGQYAEDVWKDLLEQGEDWGAIPCGLAARDSLRLEAGFALHGHEITPEINPYEAGLRWTVAMERHYFVGRGALERADKLGLKRKLAGFKTSTRSAPRAGHQVMMDGNEVGNIVSGVSSPTLEVGIATGFLSPAELAKSSNKVSVGREGRFQEAGVVVPARFYKRPTA